MSLQAGLPSKGLLVFSKLFRSSSVPFVAPFWTSVLVGSALASGFYVVILKTPFSHPLLNRYVLCHAVAIVSVYMFMIALVSIVQKLIAVFVQSQLAVAGCRVLDELAASAANTSPIDNASWLGTLWKAQTTTLCQSWFGQRLEAVLSRQIARGSCRLLEDDLHELADKDADQQHESYGLVRMMTWAMPMLGFLGTVIGISDTLGQMDTKALASGSQEAMNSLTAGLYVAFDTTAVGLVLTMATMFVMFGVSRVEQALLGTLDDSIAKSLQGILSEPEEDNSKDFFQVEKTVRLVTDQFLVAIDRVVQTQADVWKGSIAETQTRWSELSSTAGATLQSSLTQALDESLGKHAIDFTRAQQDGVAQLDARYQQWQTTLSEQTRTIHTQHESMATTMNLLRELVEKCDAFRMMEEGLQQNLSRLTDVDRFHEAAICLTEAVAVLGTQMERAGYIGKQAVRRSNNVAPGSSTLPIRKAA